LHDFSCDIFYYDFGAVLKYQEEGGEFILSVKGRPSQVAMVLKRAISFMVDTLA